MSHRAYEVMEEYRRTANSLGELIKRTHETPVVDIRDLPKMKSLDELYERR